MDIAPFDLSFDAGLRRLEERVGRVEHDASGVSSSLNTALMRLEQQSGTGQGVVGVANEELRAVQRVGGR